MRTQDNEIRTPFGSVIDDLSVGIALFDYCLHTKACLAQQLLSPSYELFTMTSKAPFGGFKAADVA